MGEPQLRWLHRIYDRMVELPVFCRFDAGAGKRVLPLKGVGECP